MPFYTLFACLGDSKDGTAPGNGFKYGLDYDDVIFLTLLDLSKEQLLAILACSESRTGQGVVEADEILRITKKRIGSEPSTLEIYMALQVKGHMDCYPKFVSKFRRR